MGEHDYPPYVNAYNMDYQKIKNLLIHVNTPNVVRLNLYYKQKNGITQDIVIPNPYNDEYCRFIHEEFLNDTYQRICRFGIHYEDFANPENWLDYMD